MTYCEMKTIFEDKASEKLKKLYKTISDITSSKGWQVELYDELEYQKALSNHEFAVVVTKRFKRFQGTHNDIDEITRQFDPLNEY